ncbi:MAG: dCTP deaminase, partial [Methanomassiliicoccaceae archaeon]|nr:dCTP deaminase [Methanomassiliicoccaceae archaeon]
MFYVSTVERVRMPPDVCAQLWLRTSWIRKGIMGAFGKIDAGFEGTLTLGAYNASDNAIEIPIGERFCQMVFETLHSAAAEDYGKRSGNYQGQTGVTLDPKK